MFLEQYWGGPTTYSEQRGHPRLRMRHHPYAVTPHMRDRWLHHMREAVEELALPPLHASVLWDYLERAAHSMVNAMEDPAAAAVLGTPANRFDSAAAVPLASWRDHFAAADLSRPCRGPHQHPVVARRRHLPGLPALVRRRRRRRHRRPARHHQPDPVPARPRRRRDLGLALLHLAAGRRRLRRRRLHRHRPDLRHPGRRRHLHRHGARGRHQGRGRPGAQPLQRRARLVPGRPGGRPGQPRARHVHVPRRQGPGRRASRPPTGGRSSAAPPGPGSPSRTAPPASGTCTCSTSSSPT